MAVEKTLESVKLELDLTGNKKQTVPNIEASASVEAMYTTANAIGDLHEETLEKVFVIEKSTLA